MTTVEIRTGESHRKEGWSGGGSGGVSITFLFVQNRGLEGD